MWLFSKSVNLSQEQGFTILLTSKQYYPLNFFFLIGEFWFKIDVTEGPIVFGPYITVQMLFCKFIIIHIQTLFCKL